MSAPSRRHGGHATRSTGRHAALAAAGAAFAAYAAASYAVMRRVDAMVHEPYMDEMFHIPQAQRYCRGEFGAWDPKLTTPPGLYLASLALVAGARALGLSRAPCSVGGLRAANWALSLALFWTLYGLVRRLHRDLSAWATAAATLALALFPLSFFFHHLFYTDTASLLLVLLTYLLSLHRRHALAGLAGAASLWMRQTNVVWVALIGASAALHWLQSRHGIARPGDSLACSLAQLGRWAVRLSGADVPLFRLLAPYVLVAALFAVFVVVNGGIVLGDKAHHQAGVHVPQLLYFCAYLAAMAAPAVLPAADPRALARAAARSPVRSAALILALSAAMAVGIARYTVEHPFLLSDNRHYTFYIWKDIFRRHWAARYLAIPAYLYAVVAVQRSLGHMPALWQIALLLCTAAVLIPSPLLEFRYFTAPYYFARLHMPLAPSWRYATLELLWFATINAATIWMFLYRPFETEPGCLQRFMW
ncbi:glucosyltransferase [Coemansia biformis]|uniref:Dol-P-Glc:Glc(2)Man(9)GlcNAc(2)-PP-Dol alpha-1,2-glucosyltransferase n=1 Tax=Coemansia biformis TaxID=1286918 RepID=A0A9W7Y9E5_9FUNG|nr:glucosyltransferase [Coemansia biformis]